MAAHLAGDLGLAHLPLPVGRRRHLRQMGDAHDLMAAPKRFSIRPTISATRPPIPASTSSNTSVGTSATAVVTVWIARLSRDSSPPEATLASGRDRRTRIRCNQELDLFQTVRAVRLEPARAQPRSARLPWPGPASARVTRRVELLGGACALLRQPLRDLPIGLLGRELALRRAPPGSPHRRVREALRSSVCEGLWEALGADAVFARRECARPRAAARPPAGGVGRDRCRLR